MAETQSQVDPPLLSLQSRCVGCQNRPEVTEKVVQAPDDVWMTLLNLEFEPDNPYDADAIKISFDDELLGYIPRDAQIPARRFLRNLAEIKKTKEVVLDWDIEHVQWESEKVFKWFEFTVRVYGSERE